MTNRHLLSTLAILLLPLGLSAAEPAPSAKEAPLDTRFLRDYAETRGFQLGRPVRARPTPDGKAVLFLRAQPRVAKLSLYEFDVASGKTRELLTPEMVLKGAEEHLSAEEKARRERQRVSVGGFTDFQVSDDSALILVSLSGKLYVVERDGGAIKELNTGEGTILDPKFVPEARQVSYVRDNDVYVYDLAAGKERRLTEGGSEELTHGLAEFVAQEEMDRNTGYWFSHDGKSLAYEEVNSKGVEVWSVADPAKPEQRPHPSAYPRPGKSNVEVKVGVQSPDGHAWLEWDHKRYPYLAQVRWHKKGPLTILVQTRDQKEVLLLEADPKTGKTKTLLTEKDEAWVNLHQDVPRWLEDGSGFLWVAETTGGPRLELHFPNGEFKRVIVSVKAGFQSLVDVDGKTGQVYFLASKDPTQAQLYHVDVAALATQPVALTKDAGLHAATFAKNHAVYVLSTAASEVMPKATVYRTDGTSIDALPSVAEEPPFVPRAELVKVGEEPGYYAAIIRPRDFDVKKHYPVIVHVYGGPRHQQVVASMGTRLLDQWLADRGFVVVSLDGRGTPNRGHDWERAVSKRFGSVPLDDQVAGLNALGKRFPELDLEHVGIYGWSFGGYLSALAVLRRPDVFKAGIAGAPVTDWLDYDTHYTERYLGLPDTDKAAYDEASLLTYAADLKRPLFLIHGTTDDNVYFRHTLKLADALFRAGKEFDLLPLSGFTHMVPDPVVTERLWTRTAGYFEKHLGKPR